MPALRLIVGLGNPGNEYLNTRHNVGAEWLDGLARSYDAQFKENSKLEGWVAKAMIEGTECLLLKPMTYMNESGLSVRLAARYFQIPINAILVAHDEMAFTPGTVRIKLGGGANGHNGLRSLFSELSNNREFYRLRIGVGHPGEVSKVTPYLTRHKIPSQEQNSIGDALNFPPTLIKEIVNADWEKAMTRLHSEPGNTSRLL